MSGKRRFVLVHAQAQDNAVRFIRGLELDPDRPWRVEVSHNPVPRTLEQNALQHRIYAAVSAETGYTPEEIKDIMVIDTIGVESYEWNGQLRERRRSTKGLTVKQGSEFIEMLYAWCAENGFQV